MIRTSTFTRQRMLPVALAVLLLTAALTVAPRTARAQTSQLPLLLQANTSDLPAERLVRFPHAFTLADDPSWFVAGPTGTLDHPGRLRWTTWNHAKAVAHGGLWVSDSQLTAATEYPMVMTLSDPHTLSGHLVFLHLNIRLTGHRLPRTFTRVTSARVERADPHSRYYLWSNV
jgi:hypothetical protein